MPRNRKIKSLFVLLFIAVISQSGFAQWVRPSYLNAEWVNCFTSVTNVNGQAMNYQFIGTDKGVYISTNYGNEWIPWSTGLTDLGIKSIVQIGNSSTLLAAGNGGVFRSTNLGVNWSSVSSYENGFTYPIVSSMVFIDKYIFAGTESGIFRTEYSGNNALSWTKVNNKQLIDSAVTSLMVVDYQQAIYIFSGARGGVYATPNFGNSWAAAKQGFITGTTIYGLAAKKNSAGYVELFAGTSLGIYKSTDFGNYWSQVNSNLMAPIVYCIMAYGNNIFVGTSGGVFRSGNSGLSWISVGMGPTETPYSYINSIAVMGQYLMVGTYQGGVWRRYLQEIGVPVDKDLNELPKEFILNQNYPNPFNPTTTIRYSIPSAETKNASSIQRVILKVYDLLGREVATLVDEAKSAGTYTVNFNGSNLTAGVYFYTLQSGGNTITRKMILLK